MMRRADAPRAAPPLPGPDVLAPPDRVEPREHGVVRALRGAAQPDRVEGAGLVAPLQNPEPPPARAGARRPVDREVAHEQRDHARGRDRRVAAPPPVANSRWAAAAGLADR